MAEPRTHRERAERAYQALLDLPLRTTLAEEVDAIARETFPTELVQAARKIYEAYEFLMGMHGKRDRSPVLDDLRAALALYPTEETK